MNHFQYKGNELYAEEVALKDIVAKVGSPENLWWRSACVLFSAYCC